MGRVAIILGVLASVVTLVAFLTGIQSVDDIFRPPYLPPSFDCAIDRSTNEQIVCSDPALTQKDRTLAALYAHARAGASGQDSDNLIATQRKWLKMREDCHQPNVKACISTLYDMRIAELRARR